MEPDGSGRRTARHPTGFSRIVALLPLPRAAVYIVAIAWIYVVLVTEASVVAGVMAFVFHGALPVGILHYLAGSGRRRRRRQAQGPADAVEREQ
jgi:hypothetical protein